MIAPDNAAALREAVWAAIVDLAETAHECAVSGQATPNAPAAADMLQLARDIAQLAETATLATNLKGLP